jgi:hypothetical protein
VRALTGLLEAGGFSAAEAHTPRAAVLHFLGEPQVRASPRETGERERMVRILAGA